MHINKACINAFEKGQQKLSNEENVLACVTFIKKYRAYIVFKKKIVLITNYILRVYNKTVEQITEFYLIILSFYFHVKQLEKFMNSFYELRR